MITDYDADQWYVIRLDNGRSKFQQILHRPPPPPRLLIAQRRSGRGQLLRWETMSGKEEGVGENVLDKS